MRAAERDAKVAAAVARDSEKTELERTQQARLKSNVRRFEKALNRGVFRPIECYRKCRTGKPVRAMRIVEGPGLPARPVYICADCEAKIKIAQIANQRAQMTKIDRAVVVALSP